MSKVLVISTSLRAKSNSDILTERIIAGADDAGHEVEHISLKGKDLKFCIGCLACQKTQQCVLNVNLTIRSFSVFRQLAEAG